MAEHDVEQVWHEKYLPRLDQIEMDLGYTGMVEVPLVMWDQIKTWLYEYDRMRAEHDARDEIFQTGYEAGYDDGYARGEESGYIDGRSDGFNEGLEEARTRI